MLFHRSYLCRDRFFFYRNGTTAFFFFFLRKKKMKQHWLCNDRSLLTLPTQSEKCSLQRGHQKPGIKQHAELAIQQPQQRRILLFDTFANAELLFTEHLSPVKHTVVSSQCLTQTNDLLWAMQFPQRNRQRIQVYFWWTQSRVNDLVQKKQHQRQIKDNQEPLGAETGYHVL